MAEFADYFLTTACHAQMRRGIFLAVLTQAWHTSKYWGLIRRNANPGGKKPDSEQPNDPAGATSFLSWPAGPTRNIPSQTGRAFTFYANASFSVIQPINSRSRDVIMHAIAAEMLASHMSGLRVCPSAALSFRCISSENIRSDLCLEASSLHHLYCSSPRPDLPVRVIALSTSRFPNPEHLVPSAQGTGLPALRGLYQPD
jgi:hypothetical protein